MAVVRRAKQIPAEALSSSECHALPARLFCNLNAIAIELADRCIGLQALWILRFVFTQIGTARGDIGLKS